MNNFKSLTALIIGFLFVSSSLYAADLSVYRQFHLNADLSGVAQEAGVNPAEAIVIHQRPALIQELSWRTAPGDSVSDIVFGFYNGDLFRMVVSYDLDNTDGLTTADMIDAISAQYGAATTDPSAEISLSSIYDDSEIVQVLARWEDPSWFFNLVRSKYRASFFLVALSKRLSPVAGKAVIEAGRLDREEAPQRELDRKSKEQDEKLLQQENARIANRADFRP